MLILASRSPQRRAILQRVGIAFEVVVSGVAEIESGDAAEVALGNAERKADAVLARCAERADALVLGADTVVALGATLFGKPADEAEARVMLRSLGGQTQTVVTGLALLSVAARRTAVVQTRVRFRPLDDRIIDWYVARGEWQQRAGGYAIQGAGSALVTAVEGDYENVVGLPLAALLDMCPELLFG
jgi:septum formation protein